MYIPKRIPWDVYYQTLCQIYEENGTVNISYSTSFCKNGLAIGRWIRRQRNVYSIGKMKSDRIVKLEKLGFVWNGNGIKYKILKEKWDKIFALAEAYYIKNGNLRIPRNYVIEGVDVGIWLTNLKGGYRGKNKRHLSEYQISKLESIGIEWDYDYLEDLWNKMYHCSKKYFAIYGNIHVPQGYNYEELPLGNWIHDQTQLYTKGKLSQDRIDKLNKLGIRWKPQQDKWITYYKYAKQYFKEIGNLDVPYDFEIDGISLGRWIGVQRQAYRGRQDTCLTKEQIKKLDAIGMLWESNSSTQTSFGEQIIYYYIARLYPSATNRYKDLGCELDIYIPDLNIAIEYDGYYWHKDKQESDNLKDSLCKENGITLIRIREHLLPKTTYAQCYILQDNTIDSFQQTLGQMLEECLHVHPYIDIKRDGFEVVKCYKTQSTSPWYKAFLEAKNYFEKNGNLVVPNGHTTSSGLSLASWIKNQRQRRNGNTKPLSLEQISLLDSIGMVWNPYESSWEKGYSYAKMYYEEFYNLSVPQSCVYKGFALGKWINGQRVNRKNYYKTKPERISKLEQIGMIWDAKESSWETGFMHAKEYFNNKGNLLVPSDYRTKDGFCLGAWIQSQRKLKIIRRLYDVQPKIDKLDTIGMVWVAADKHWTECFNIAKSYFEKYGNLLVPQNFVYKEFRLGHWINRLRTSKTLNNEKRKQLESIGMVWNVLDYSWNMHYSLICEFYEEFGTINIPRNTIYKNVDIGTWLKNLKTARKKGRKKYLTDERISLMDKIGMKW